MRNLLLGWFLIVVALPPVFAQGSLVGKEFHPNLNSKIYETQKSRTEREFSKEVVVVRFLNPENVRIDFELEIWKTFIQAMDTSLIGFVFYSNGGEGFQQTWKNYIGSSAPLIIDTEKVVSNLNKISEDPTYHTLILGKDRKVLLQGGSPIVSDGFNDFRNSIARELLSQGIDRGVKGVIIDRSKDHMQWFMGEPVYLLPNGQVISNDEAMNRMVEGKVYPKYSSLTDTVRLVNRN